jgi:pimeloyl-ACP methyl ester carboxylesterase
MAIFFIASLIATTGSAAQNVSAGGVRIESGSGSFTIAGGDGHEEKVLTIFYHKPAKYSPASNILIVLPGAGRNANDYRDAWVAAAEKYNVLVLSPSYSEEHYPDFWSYNLAGMITDVKINQGAQPAITFKVNRNSGDWIYQDFDRIFVLVKEHLKSSQNSYDMFGHSAGGQVIHRLALFHPNGMANRMLAANSGWYTVPTFEDEFPYGLADGVTTKPQSAAAFAVNLVVFLGERDDENETRGDLARTPEIDVQGLSRIARGKYFYAKAVQTAKELGITLNWKLEIVPGVGHDYRRMSEAAADYLY